MKIDANTTSVFGLDEASGLRIKTLARNGDALAGTTGEVLTSGEGAAQSLAQSLVQEAETVEVSRTASASRNMMEGNFVSATTERSRYIRATLTAFEVEAQQKSTKDGLAVDLLEMANGLYSGNEWESEYTAAIKKARQIDRMMEREMGRSVVNESEEDLAEAKQDIEQAAEEALTGGEGEAVAEAGAISEVAAEAATTVENGETGSAESADSSGAPKSVDLIV